MKKASIIVIILLLISSVVGCSPNNRTEQTILTVSAAASLQDVLNELKLDFEEKHPHIKINYNFAGSGSLQQQIIQGAPVDLYFSAAKDKFDHLVQENLIEKEINLVGNELVLIVPVNTSSGVNDFEDLSKATKISIGTPETVPAGKYAKELLKNTNVWSDIFSKIVYAKDVRQVLTYVETGNVDAGIVYKTDALSSSKVEVIASADDKTHSPIIYPLGVIRDSGHIEEAMLFYEFLQYKTSIEIFEKYGFRGLNYNE